MRDPHVVSLRYRLVPDEYTKFEEPPPLDWEEDAFSLHLENSVASFSMKQHFSSVDEAREKVDPWLRAWELDVALTQHGLQGIRFDFDSVEVIDRNPLPAGTSRVCEGRIEPIRLKARVGVSFSAYVTRNQYPKPPHGFTVSLDVEVMWLRYEGYRDGKEPLPAMAFFCLTVVQARGERREVAKELNIERKVLSKLGELSSAVGDPRAARKFNRSGRDHTKRERRWPEAAVLAIIRRVGQYDFDPTATFPRLTMADLPGL